jgi:hypothetical protein
MKSIALETDLDVDFDLAKRLSEAMANTCLGESICLSWYDRAANQECPAAMNPRTPPATMSPTATNTNPAPRNAPAPVVARAGMTNSIVACKRWYPGGRWDEAAGGHGKCGGTTAPQT